MKATSERRLLQVVIVAASLVPLTAGLFGVLGLLGPSSNFQPVIDSHLRYLSGLLLAIGLAFVWCARRIEKRTDAVRLLTFVVVVGGIARLLAVPHLGLPSGTLMPLIMELVVTPLLCVWQARVAGLSFKIDGIG